MLKGKQGRVMSMYGTGDWDTKQVLTSKIVERIREVEEEIEFYETFDGDEDILGKIVENYKQELKKLKEVYSDARKL